MKMQDLQRKLEAMGFKPNRHTLEPYDWLEEDGPAGALDSVSCYRLIDKMYHREFDVVSRNWKPVLAVGDEVLVDSSPEMFTRLLAAVGYYDRPDDFEDELVFQIHGFALDFFDGHRVRERSLERGENQVIIRGIAGKGAGRKARSVPFETRAVRGKVAEFSAHLQ